MLSQSTSTRSSKEQDPSLAFLNRVLDRMQRDPAYHNELAEGISRGAGDRVFALIDDPDDVGRFDAFEAIDLDDTWLEQLSGGRSQLPLALVLLAGALGSGHALPHLGAQDLGGLQRLASGQAHAASGLQPGWDELALPLIREFEGLALEAYLDPVGIATIGYGTIRYPGGQEVQLGDRISAEQAEQLLRQAVEGRYAPELLAAIPQARRYSAPQQAALISFTYNVGVGALQRSSLRRRLLSGEDPELVIAEELPRWSRGDGRQLAGLVRRRAAEVALFTGA